MRVLTSVLVASLLVVSTLAHAQADKKQPKTAASEVGNRCPGGTFDKCLAAVVKTGVKPRSASEHCTKTCK